MLLLMGTNKKSESKNRNLMAQMRLLESLGEQISHLTKRIRNLKGTNYSSLKWHPVNSSWQVHFSLSLLVLVYLSSCIDQSSPRGWWCHQPRTLKVCIGTFGTRSWQVWPHEKNKNSRLFLILNMHFDYVTPLTSIDLATRL